MSLYQELKRRNVIRVVIAYLALAWLLIEVASVLFPSFDIPDWAFRFLVIVIAFGFIPTLVFSWAFEITPEGVKREKDVVREASITHETARRLDVITIGVVVVALSFIAIDLLWLSAGTSPQATIPATISMADPQQVGSGLKVSGDLEPSIAVLPFANRSANSDDAFFVDGIHDDLLSHISKISAIKTISRTSVMRYRESTQSIPEIAAELGVATVLEGGIQRAGDVVRINVQLIDASTDSHVWSEIYDRQLTAENIFAIQSEIARAIAISLKTTLTPPEQERMQTVPTKNLAAYEAYLLGKQKLAQLGTASLADAVDYFRKALDLDAHFAPAWVGLADAYIAQAYTAGMANEEMYAPAEAALQTALELNVELGEAHASLGHLNYRQNNLKEAGRNFDQALQLTPNYAELHRWYSLLLAELGRWEESINWRASAVELDPMSAELRRSYATALRQEGRIEEALEQLEIALEIDPDFVGALDAIATIQWQIYGHLDTAAQGYHQLIAQNPNHSSNFVWLAQLYLDLGDPDRARKLLDRADELSPDFGVTAWGRLLMRLYDEKVDDVTINNAKAFLSDSFGADWHIQFCLSQFRNQEMANNNLVEARQVYSQRFPELLDRAEPTIDLSNYRAAIDLALIMQKLADEERAALLLERSSAFIQKQPRLGWWGGYWIYDVQILALQGKTVEALAALRRAADEGWRSLWWYYLHYEPNLDSLREEPEFQVVVDEIKENMARQMAHVREMELSGEMLPFSGLLIETE